MAGRQAGWLADDGLRMKASVVWYLLVTFTYFTSNTNNNRIRTVTDIQWFRNRTNIYVGGIPRRLDQMKAFGGSTVAINVLLGNVSRELALAKFLTRGF